MAVWIHSRAREEKIVFPLFKMLFLATTTLCVLVSPALAADQTPLSAPPQDQGLPYTRSARTTALAKIRDQVAVFAGSRYAYVQGVKVRLDDQAWRQEAVLQEGVLYVPVSFASVLALAKVTPPPAPDYLKDRWVYTLDRPTLSPAHLAKARKRTVDGKEYIALADVAKAMGQKVMQHPRGLLLIGATPVSFTSAEETLLDSVITLFDTPEKFADPDIATRAIPVLKRQGKWTDHVKVTREQLERINYGPETKWPTTPAIEYDLTGFDAKLLGSKVPAPGVYPRVLFSPEDVSMLAKRLQSSKTGQRALIEMDYLFKKSWWDPATSDGKIFQKLASGDLAGLEWAASSSSKLPSDVPHLFKGQTPGIHNSHVGYVPECLTAMALYCLLTGDDAHGRQAAAAVANYYRLREPLIDAWNALSDSEFGSSTTLPDGTVASIDGNGAATQWRGMHGLVANMNLGLSLDFSGKWMTAEQKEQMRRVIVKATYGRRPYGQDGPTRVRDINWVAWDLPHFLALCAIEGLDGMDREAYDSDRDTIRAFCDWGIDSSGVIYESNGKTPGGMQFQLLSMIALARRGENLWGHPHWRRLLEGQIQMTSPDGRVVVNSGTQYVPFSRSLFSPQAVDEIKAFYPGNRCADYLLDQVKQHREDDENLRAWILDDFSPAEYRAKVGTVKNLRLPSVTYPGFVQGVLYSTDFQPATRADLNLPLDFNAPMHGVFSSYSDRTPDAAWINMMVRPDHYLGAGHHHADAGMIHFSGLGVNWFTESPFSQTYDGKYHNQVLVDDRSEPDNIPGTLNGYNAAAKYLGARLAAEGASATADLTYAYSYRWNTQPPQIWKEPLSTMGWELDPSPEILKIFAGSGHNKMRPWWLTYNYSNYIATSRAPFNPMQYVFRTTGLVRGAHPYGLVVDDLKKDDRERLYQWTAMLNGGVWQAEYPGLAPNQVALAFRQPDPTGKIDPARRKSPMAPKAGEPLLLVVALTPSGSGDASLPLIRVETAEGPADRQGKPQVYDRLAVNVRAKESAYKVLLIPFRMGETLPQVTFDPARNTARVQWADGVDQIQFTREPSHRYRFTVRRNDNVIVESS